MLIKAESHVGVAFLVLHVISNTCAFSANSVCCEKGQYFLNTKCKVGSN